jgi:hypothetical protein
LPTSRGTALPPRGLPAPVTAGPVRHYGRGALSRRHPGPPCSSCSSTNTSEVRWS